MNFLKGSSSDSSRGLRQVKAVMWGNPYKTASPARPVEKHGTPVLRTPEWLPSVTVNQQVNHITTSKDRAEEIRKVIDGQPRRVK
jgi:hypothetical protein